MVLPWPQSSACQLSSECSLEVKPGRVVQLLVDIPATQVSWLEITVAETSWELGMDQCWQLADFTLLHCCSCWRSWRCRSGDVWKSRAAFLAKYELEVINSYIAKDFVASLGRDDNFVMELRFGQVHSAQRPGRNSMFGGEVPDQFLAGEQFIQS